MTPLFDFHCNTITMTEPNTTLVALVFDCFKKNLQLEQMRKERPWKARFSLSRWQGSRSNKERKISSLSFGASCGYFRKFYLLVSCCQIDPFFRKKNYKLNFNNGNSIACALGHSVSQALGEARFEGGRVRISDSGGRLKLRAGVAARDGEGFGGGAWERGGQCDVMASSIGRLVSMTP
jgi:hypothetical protein